MQRPRDPVEAHGQLGEPAQGHERHEDPLDPLFLDDVEQPLEVVPDLLADQDERVADRQRGHHLLVEDVEAERGPLQGAAAAAGALALLPLHLVVQGPV